MRYITYHLNVVLFTTLTCILISCGNNSSKSVTDSAADSVWVEEVVETVESIPYDTVQIQEEEESMESKVRNLELGGHKLKGRMRPNKTMDDVFTFYNDGTMTVDIYHVNGESTQGTGYWERKKRSYHDVEYEWCELRYHIAKADVDARAILDSELRLYGPIDDDEADHYNMAELCAIMADKSHPKYEIIQKFITPLDIVK